MLLCFPLMILGCGKDVDPSQWTAPIVTEFTSVACPAIDTKTRAEFNRSTPRAEPNTADVDGKPAVSKRRAQEWIDALEVSEARKNKAGKALIAEHDRCRGGEPGNPLDPKTTS